MTLRRFTASCVSVSEAFDGNDQTSTESPQNFRDDARHRGLPARRRLRAASTPAAQVHARQEMWRRRQSGDSPWTTDALLAYYKFCNIYRELDRGTVYFRGSVERRKRVLPAAGAHLLRDVLWGSLVYRLLNRMESFQSWKEGGGLPNEHEWPCFLEYLAAQRAEGRVIFSNAHQTMGFDRYASTMAKVRKTLQKLTDAVWAARSSAERVFKILLRYENVGPFFAWQVTCDLLETAGVLDCDEDDWCQIGPGALRGDDPAPKRRNGTGAFYLEKSRHVGLKRVFAHAPPATCAVNLDRARLLTSLHSAAFIALDCSFSYVGDRRLTLKNIEHALCEQGAASFSGTGREATKGECRGRAAAAERLFDFPLAGSEVLNRRARLERYGDFVVVSTGHGMEPGSVFKSTDVA